MEIKVTFPGNKKVDAQIGEYTIHTDQPTHGGGDGTAPSPFILFLASLGTCAGIFIKSFCDSRGISSEKIEIIQKLEFDRGSNRISKVILEVQLPSDFPEKYKDAVLLSANQCAVKQYLANPFEVESVAVFK